MNLDTIGTTAGQCQIIPCDFLLGRFRKEKAEKNNKIFVGSKEKTCLIAKGVESFIFFADRPYFYFDRLRKQLWAKCVFFLEESE